MGSLTISKQFGVNPSVEVCMCCGKEMGVVMFGTSYKDENGKTAEAPRSVCVGNLCDDCKRVISDGGIFFLECRKGSDPKNPYRTGRIVAIKKEVAQRIFGDGFKAINYLEDEAFEKIFGDALRDHDASQKDS